MEDSWNAGRSCPVAIASCVGDRVKVSLSHVFPPHFLVFKGFAEGNNIPLSAHNALLNISFFLAVHNFTMELAAILVSS